MRTYIMLMAFLFFVGIVLIMDTLDHMDFFTLAWICEPWIYGCTTLIFYRVKYMSSFGRRSSWKCDGFIF